MKNLSLIILCFATLAFGSKSYAQSKIYDSDVCDFTAEFPEEIFVNKRCVPSANGSDKEICGETVSYVKVFDNNTSLDIRISCNKIDKDTYNRFSKDEILFTFESLIRGNKDIHNYGMSYSKYMKSKRAYSLASGKSGLSPMINILYLWVGENSFMSVDAKLIGDANKEADEMFTAITTSIKNKELDVPSIEKDAIDEDNTEEKKE